MEKVFNEVRKFLVAININENKIKFGMLLYFGGDYLRDIIDNVLSEVEGYNATVEYLNEHLDPKNNSRSDETVQECCNRLRSIANRCNLENEDKHKNAVNIRNPFSKITQILLY